MAGEVKAVSVMWTEIPKEVEHDLNEWYDRDSLATFAPVPLSVGTIEQTLEIMRRYGAARVP